MRVYKGGEIALIPYQRSAQIWDTKTHSKRNAEIASSAP